jgi:MFS family permease
MTPDRQRNGRALAFWIVAGGPFSLLLGANVAATLYATYSRDFGFSSAMLAVIFATYTLVLVPALLACGQLSDRFGRRPVILAGVCTGIVGLVLFALADSVPWLFAARAAQGLSVAMISGAAVAALTELEPRHDAWRSALVATLALTGGSAIAPFIGGAIAEWAPDPMVTPYLAAIGLVAAIGVVSLTVPETIRERAAGGWRIQRPGVPREIRGAFIRIGVTGAAVWSVAALFLSVLPSYTTEISGSTNLAALGAVASVMLVTSCLSQLVVGRQAERTGALAAGLGLLAVGLVGLDLASPLDAVGAMVAGAAVSGAGHGVGFLAAQHDLNRIAPDERRGEVNAAFYTCIYLGVSVSVIGVGLFAHYASLFTGVVVFSIVTGAASLVVGAWQLAANGGRREARRGRWAPIRGRT